MTHLARRAAAQYFKDKNISDLTRERKVYIEDYMSKHNNPVSIDIGNSRTFSTSLLDQAVQSAHSLTAAQLANLHQYALRVPGL